MAQWQLYVTWGLLVIIALELSGVSSDIQKLRADFKEYRDERSSEVDEQYEEEA